LSKLTVFMLMFWLSHHFSNQPSKVEHRLSCPFSYFEQCRIKMMIFFHKVWIFLTQLWDSELHFGNEIPDSAQLDSTYAIKYDIAGNDLFSLNSLLFDEQLSIIRYDLDRQIKNFQPIFESKLQQTITWSWNRIQ
jgi:hypothetical protein